MTPRKPILGLIGAIGAGKSTAAAIFARHGAAIIDADQLGHDVLESPAVRAEVIRAWPQVVGTDGRIDRRALARIVFADPTDRRRLESWMFPEIRRRCEAAIAVAQLNPAVEFVVLDAAVMLEAGWTNVCDTLIYIDAPRESRLQRLATRSGWSAADLAAREAAQMPADEKKRHADFILQNDGTPDDLATRIARALPAWLNRADRQSSRQSPLPNN